MRRKAGGAKAGDGIEWDYGGDLSGVRGDLSGVRGDLSGVRGDLTGVWGYLSGTT